MARGDWALGDAYSTRGNAFHAAYYMYMDHSYFNNPEASHVMLSNILTPVDDARLRSFGFRSGMQS